MLLTNWMEVPEDCVLVLPVVDVNVYEDGLKGATREGSWSGSV